MRAISWYIVLLYAVIYYKNTWCQWDQLSKAFSQPCRGHHESESLNVCNSFIMRMKLHVVRYPSQILPITLQWVQGAWRMMGHDLFDSYTETLCLFYCLLHFVFQHGLAHGDPLLTTQKQTPQTHTYTERERKKQAMKFFPRQHFAAQNKNRCVHIDGNGAKDLIISQG